MGTNGSVAEIEPETDHIPGVEVADGEDAAAETPERDREASIHLRLWNASADIGQLEKDGKVKIGRDGYEYITHDNVTAHAKRAFLRHGIMVIPTILEHGKDGNRTELKVRARFVNIDKADDFVEVDGIGYGVDSSDKGPGKAYSYALKYIYMKVLMLNSADDVEEGETQHEPSVPPHALAQEKANVKQTKEAWATTYKAALESAQSVDEVKALEKTNRKQLMSEGLPEVTREYFIDLAEARKAALAE